MIKKQEKSRLSVFKTGIVLVFLSLVILTIHLVIRILKNNSSDNNQTQIVNEPENVQDQDTSEDRAWEVYTNEEFGFELLIPRLLTEREWRDQGGYKYFMRFEETKFSVDKGVAVGVSDSNLGSEVKRLKDNLEKEGAKLVKEQKTVIGGKEGVLLEYEPEDVGGGEKRVVVIVENPPSVYSISTAPEQIEKVIDGFIFL